MHVVAIFEIVDEFRLINGFHMNNGLLYKYQGNMIPLTPQEFDFSKGSYCPLIFNYLFLRVEIPNGR